MAPIPAAGAPYVCLDDNASGGDAFDHVIEMVEEILREQPEIPAAAAAAAAASTATGGHLREPSPWSCAGFGNLHGFVGLDGLSDSPYAVGGAETDEFDDVAGGGVFGHVVEMVEELLQEQTPRPPLQRPPPPPPQPPSYSLGISRLFVEPPTPWPTPVQDPFEFRVSPLFDQMPLPSDGDVESDSRDLLYYVMSSRFERMRDFLAGQSLSDHEDEATSRSCPVTSSDCDSIAEFDHDSMAGDRRSVASSMCDLGIARLFEGEEMSDYDASSYVTYDGISEQDTDTEFDVLSRYLDSDLEESSEDDDRDLGLALLFDDMSVWEDGQDLGLVSLFDAALVADGASDTDAELHYSEEAESSVHDRNYEDDEGSEYDVGGYSYYDPVLRLPRMTVTPTLARTIPLDDDSDYQNSTGDDDPDGYSYEELVLLGELIGHESRGLSWDIIASLPSVKYVADDNKDGDSDMCVICQMEYELDEDLTVLTCKHLYHSQCINKWLRIKKRCPLCSTEIAAVTENIQER